MPPEVPAESPEAYVEVGRAKIRGLLEGRVFVESSSKGGNQSGKIGGGPGPVKKHDKSGDKKKDGKKKKHDDKKDTSGDDLDDPADPEKIFPKRLEHSTYTSYEEALRAALYFVRNGKVIKEGDKPKDDGREKLTIKMDVYLSTFSRTDAFFREPDICGVGEFKSDGQNSEDFLRLDYDDDCGPHFNAKYVGSKSTMGDRDQCPKEHFLIAEPSPKPGEKKGEYLERVRAQVKEWRDDVRGYRGPDPLDRILDFLTPENAYLDNTDPGDPKPNVQDAQERARHLERLWSNAWAKGTQPKSV